MISMIAAILVREGKQERWAEEKFSVRTQRFSVLPLPAE